MPGAAAWKRQTGFALRTCLPISGWVGWSSELLENVLGSSSPCTFLFVPLGGEISRAIKARDGFPPEPSSGKSLEIRMNFLPSDFLCQNFRFIDCPPPEVEATSCLVIFRGNLRDLGWSVWFPVRCEAPGSLTHQRNKLSNEKSDEIIYCSKNSV